MSKLPLLDQFRTGDIVGWHDGDSISVARFLAAAHALAQRMPNDARCMNLCKDRLNFALGLAATLIRGNVTLLPPSHVPATIDDIAANFGPVYSLVDNHAASRHAGIDLACWPVTTPAPQIDPQLVGEQIAIMAFTSGSTGVPSAHARNWQSYVEGAVALRAQLPIDHGSIFVATVPPQHMWGLEASIMLALQSGGAIHSASPLLPADICHTLAGISGQRWLVTTPLHLRTLLKSGEPLPAITGVLSATAPLEADTAQAFEAQTGATIYEIYGTTETGALATRRPAREHIYRLLPGLKVHLNEGTPLVHGGHVHHKVALNDTLRKIDEHYFVLEGRVTDMIKIAGKRASLSALNLELVAIPGVVDGVFCVPPGDDSNQRLTAFVVAPQLTRADIIAALRKRLDPLFLPRPLHLVPALPRQPSGKLTRDNLLQLMAESPTTVDTLGA